jgi:hypothetical protein
LTLWADREQQAAEAKTKVQNLIPSSGKLDSTESKMSTKSFAVFLIATLSLLGTSLAQRASKPRLVGNVTGQGLAGDCGCYFKFRSSKKDSERYIFVEKADDAPWMNIDGRDVRLRLVKETERDEKERVGSTRIRNFAAGNVSVTCTYVTTLVCADADEGCESHEYKATFLVKKGKRSESVNAVGWCGC